MNQNLPQDLDRESLNQLSKEELVETIIEQSKVIRELQKIIYELQQEIERLKVSRDLDSSNSSKPPSSACDRSRSVSQRREQGYKTPPSIRCLQLVGV